VLEARARTVNERRARAALGVPGASLLSELLTSAELDQLAASARVEWLHAGEALFREGDASADLRAAFALIAGAVDVTVAPHDGGAKALPPPPLPSVLTGHVSSLLPY
jgi:CRP-like cAMP-binding protein